MLQLSEAIEDFLLSALQEGWSAGTIKQYRWHLERFVRWLAEHEVTDLSLIDRRLLRQWNAGLREHWQPATIKQAVSAARSFLSWCHSEELLATDLSGALKSPRIPKRPQRTITSDEVMALLAGCEDPPEHGLREDEALATCFRNAAIVALLFDSLVRASELCALCLDDVDLERKRITVRRGKGGDGRTALFSGETAELLAYWLEVRRPSPCVDAFFVSIGGNTAGYPLTTRGLRIILKRLGERAGVAGVSPHAFRRGGAVQFTLNGAPGRLVMKWAGWSNSRMLELYTRALDGNQETDQVYGKYAPVKSLRGG